MKFLFASLLIVSAFSAYFLIPSTDYQKDTTHIVDRTNEPPLPQANHIDSPTINDEARTKTNQNQIDSNVQTSNLQSIETKDNSGERNYDLTEYNNTHPDHIANVESSATDRSTQTTDSEPSETLPNTESPEDKLPGEELNFKLKLHSSTHHILDGRATSDIGKTLIKSRLMPSNEVKLSITLKQSEIDDIVLLAYIDLANFTMELDGGNSILNKKHKALMALTLIHLRAKLEPQYEGYDIPEHALVLAQMLGYWSVSPDGYVHDKRSIVSQ